jgi:hypothetical protein
MTAGWSRCGCENVGEGGAVFEAKFMLPWSAFFQNRRAPWRGVKSSACQDFLTPPPRIFDLSDMPVHLSPDQLRGRMRRAYLPIASNTAVIRVDALKKFGGFPAPLRWFADSFACTALAMRHGACVLAEPLALIRSRPESYSQTMRNVPQQTEVLNAVLDLLGRAELRDIRAFMKDCPSNFTVYDPLILNLLAKRPRDWDLFGAYARWKIREHTVRSRYDGRARRFASRFWNVVRKSSDAAGSPKV